MIEEATRAYLLLDPAVNAACGGRCSHILGNQGEAYPSLVISRIGGERGYFHSGPSGLVRTRMQFDALGRTQVESWTLARAVRARISGKVFTQGGVSVGGVFLDDERQTSEASTSDGVRVFRTSLDFTIWHQET
jgi:hypothetical protein